MEIPTNTYNPQSEIDEIVNTLCERLKEDKHGNATCSCFGASLNNVVIPALQKFKDKGWFTYYQKNLQGVIIGVRVYKEHYTPRHFTVTEY